MSEEYKEACNFAELGALLPKGFGKERPKQDGLILTKLEKTRREEGTGTGGSTAVIKRSAEQTECKEMLAEIPYSHTAILRQHRRAVTAVDLDKSGVRLATGSADCTLALWDFAGMDASFTPFRVVEPAPGCPVRFLRFSPTGDTLLVGGGGAARLLDRHGALLIEYRKGDPYIRDMKVTVGHVGGVCNGAWDSIQRDRFITCGQDGTIRFWGINGRKECENVLVVQNRNLIGGGKSTCITQVAFHPNSQSIICTALDGYIRLYPTKGPWFRPSLEIKDAHAKGSEVTSLAIDNSGKMLASRGTDNTLKLWDIRNFSRPVGVVENLENTHDGTGCAFSPDQNLIATGVSVRKGDGRKGSIHFFDTVDLTPATEPLPMTDSSVIALIWPSTINQLVAGHGDGTVSILYDPQISRKGALLPLAKAPVSVSTEAVVAYSVGGIQTPNALPLFKDDSGRSLKRLRIKARKDPRSSHRPELPVDGPGTGGRLGSSVTQSIMRSVIRDTRRDEDPREALLRYAKVAETDPKFVAPAYQKTQPNPILDAELLVKEAAAEEKRLQEEEAHTAFTRRIQDKSKHK